MERTHYITAAEFCQRYGVAFSFISTLHQSGLIQLQEDEKEPLIDVEQLSDLEKYARLHYDLEINAAGIEAITYLLQRIQQQQQEIGVLKAKLQLYESDL